MHGPMLCHRPEGRRQRAQPWRPATRV